ncbi:hypothetical protein V2W45_891605 [Cenococcum geophilum]
MLRGWRSVRRVPCVYPVLPAVWLLSPSIFLTPSISASAPSNTGFFSSPKPAPVGIRMNAMQTRCTYSGRFSLCLPSLPLHLSLYIPPVLFLLHGVSSIGSSFQYTLGLMTALPCYVFAIAIAFASFALFWLRCFSYVRGCSRLGAPERYICDIQIGPGPFSPCSGEEDSGKRGGNRVFQFVFSAVVGLVCC